MKAKHFKKIRQKAKYFSGVYSPRTNDFRDIKSFEILAYSYYHAAQRYCRRRNIRYSQLFETTSNSPILSIVPEETPYDRFYRYYNLW